MFINHIICILGYINLHNNNSYYNYYELVYTVNGPGPSLIDS